MKYFILLDEHLWQQKTEASLLDGTPGGAIVKTSPRVRRVILGMAVFTSALALASINANATDTTSHHGSKMASMSDKKPSMNKTSMGKKSMGKKSMGKKSMGKMSMGKMSMNGQDMTSDPAGIAGTNMPTGAFMLNFRSMYMSMEGNRVGTNSISPETIVTTIPNPNGGPPTLRVAPERMNVQMQMLMGMYAPTDWLTVMAMGSYVRKEMDHITFAGAAGTTRLGTFTTLGKGLGDTKVSAIFRLYNSFGRRLQASAGVSLPTGSITRTDTVLAPTGATPTLRLPYPMLLGSGTYDFLPGLTYRGWDGPWSYGARYSGVIRIGDTSKGYALGDIHSLTAWGGYRWSPSFNTTLRITGQTKGKVRGRDPQIAAPVQTAVTGFQGGERVDVSLGFGLTGQGMLRGYRLGAEVGIPIYQDLNGPQLETDYTVLFSLTKMFAP